MIFCDVRECIAAGSPTALTHHCTKPTVPTDAHLLEKKYSYKATQQTGNTLI